MPKTFGEAFRSALDAAPRDAAGGKGDGSSTGFGQDADTDTVAGAESTASGSQQTHTQKWKREHGYPTTRTGRILWKIRRLAGVERRKPGPRPRDSSGW